MVINTSYAICTTQRSGSTMLCEALNNTSRAGDPREYLLFLLQEKSWWTERHGITTTETLPFLNLVFEKSATPNGVFGIKIMWNYFLNAQAKLSLALGNSGLADGSLLSAVFPNLHYIWLLRGNRVLQAVSWARAFQTGIYSSTQDAEARKQPEYDFDQIKDFYDQILEGEAGWKAYFEDNNIKPLVLKYEELAQDYYGTALSILDYLSINYPPNIEFGTRRLSKQRDTLNLEWAERFVEQLGANRRGL